MGRPLAHDAARDLDRVVLDAEVLAAQNDGRPVPCRSVPLALTSAWVDADDDPRSDALAALACAGCAVLDACRTFGDRHPEVRGVYGGRSDAQRRPRRGRPRKTA